MADYKFSFQDKGKEFNPAWLAPEGLSTFHDRIPYSYMC